ncbi:MAG: hypothetical protein V4726_24850 [Verrucomicrobiota bacterium]
METESALEWEKFCRGRKGYSADLFEDCREQPGGNEHQIFQTGDGTRAIKLTNPPSFGAWGALLPYLNNLVLNNHLHGDDQRVEAFLPAPEGGEGVQLVMTQPWILGDDAGEEEISRFMIERGFELFCPNGWISTATNVKITDARSPNIKKSEGGLLIPIDVHIVAPETVLEAAWREQAERE